MTDDVDITATLTHLATYLRRWSKGVHLQNDRRGLKALSELVESIAERHRPLDQWRCSWCGDVDMPCPDVRKALAVAEALRLLNPEGRINHA
jgi:hypothetical protein